jgi:hypothetical protein
MSRKIGKEAGRTVSVASLLSTQGQEYSPSLAERASSQLEHDTLQASAPAATLLDLLPLDLLPSLASPSILT